MSVPPERRVLVICLDGTRLDVLTEPDVAPALTAFAAAGTTATQWMPGPPRCRTDSGPGWSTLLTGVGPESHGVLDNSFGGHRLDRHRDLLTIAHGAGRRTQAALSWPALWDPAGVGPVVRPGHDREQHLDGETLTYGATDPRAAAFTDEGIATGQFDLGLLYLCAVDEAGHAHGVGRRYRSALAAADRRFATLLATVEGRVREHAEDWLVLVTTDHGHRDAGGHGGASDHERRSFVLGGRRAQQRPRGGNEPPGPGGGRRVAVEAVDLVPTVLAFLGVAPSDDDSLEGTAVAF